MAKKLAEISDNVRAMLSRTIDPNTLAAQKARDIFDSALERVGNFDAALDELYLAGIRHGEEARPKRQRRKNGAAAAPDSE